MKLKDILLPSFRASGASIGLHAEAFDGRLIVMAPIWRKSLSTNSVFCDAVVANGLLHHEQMAHAAQRYRLGATKSRGVIFWQIDHQERIHNGKLMYYQSNCHRDKNHKPTWVSFFLQQRRKWPDKPPCSRCLFGLHLLDKGAQPKIAVVEAEKTAVILSEIYPQYLWLATGGLGEVQAEKFRPLRGRNVYLFPDTDPDGNAFKRWSNAAAEVHLQLWWEDCPPITVSRILEDRASPDQKQRKIDLLDYYFETINPLPGYV